MENSGGRLTKVKVSEKDLRLNPIKSVAVLRLSAGNRRNKCPIIMET
ncbi:hypothetical protein ES708_04356 [subsurface metagenome]